MVGPAKGNAMKEGNQSPSKDPCTVEKKKECAPPPKKEGR